MNKLLVILGPTSTGKTNFALQLAKKYKGELVSCDSRQVYTGLDIGTGKMPNIDVSNQPSAFRLKKGNGFWEINGIKIWMYDVVSPKSRYTVFDYVKDATKVIEGILPRGRLPIIVGGTGLYLKALLEGLPNLAIPIDKKLRKSLEKLSKEQLQEQLKNQAPFRWSSLNESDKQNPRRLIRAIELINNSKLYTRYSIPQLTTQNKNILKIGLTAPREILYQRIDKRVVDRINQGMIEESENLYKKGLSIKRMKQLGLEYGVLADYVQGKIKNKQELITVLQGKIHGYARRQITWFKKEKNVWWFDITDPKLLKMVERQVDSWYYFGYE